MMRYHIGIKDMPPDQRPRERLLREGAASLSDQELLAVIMRTGSSDKSATDLAVQLLKLFGGLGGIFQASVEELSAVRGIGQVKAAQIKAVSELGRRMVSTSHGHRPSIRAPEDVARLLMEDLRHLDREHFCVLHLNTKHQVLARETISVGTLNTSAVHPREIFRNAIKRNAAAIILAHNHPSGDPEPSREDREVTRRIVDAGLIIGIDVLDHVIIGDNKFISFKAKGIV